MRRRLALLATATLTALASAVALAQPAAAAPLPVTWNWTKGFLPAALKPSTPPPGANNWDCRSAAHPVPVVLVHGTFEHQNDNWQAMSPYLTNKGYCVYTFNYGVSLGTLGGFKSIVASAGELKTFVETVVLPRTGASKVDLVGHSQGGMMPRYYIKFLGGYQKVHALVGLNPSNHGTTLSSLATLGALLGINPLVARAAPGLTDQVTGSAFMQALDKCPNGPAADICVGDPVKYTVIQTTEDRIVTPYTNAFLKGAKNVLIQKVCGLDNTGHIASPYDQNIAQQVANALDPAHRGRVCVKTTAFNGG
jgi:pimeloyl-ACP methyl ester carboxylesterase